MNNTIEYLSSSDSEIDSNDEINEYEEINNMFPNAPFSICLRLNELNKVVTTEKIIIIQCDFNCYCYDDCPRNTEYFIIEGEHITNKYIIEELIKQGLKIECNHDFLESIDKMPNSETKFKLWFGS